MSLLWFAFVSIRAVALLSPGWQRCAPRQSGRLKVAQVCRHTYARAWLTFNWIILAPESSERGASEKCKRRRRQQLYWLAAYQPAHCEDIEAGLHACAR